MPARSRSSRRARLLRTAFVALPLVLLAAGCSTPGAVKDYNADTRKNFVDSCVAANTADLSDDDATEICECWSIEVMGDEDGDQEARISFDRFKQIEDEIRDAIAAGQLQNPDELRSIDREFYEVITEECISVGPELN